MLELQNTTIFLTKKNLVLIENLNILAFPKQVLAIMGKSGSGKTTLLNYISGILDMNNFKAQGKIKLYGTDISQHPIHKRNIGMVFQENMLFPHMTVKQNLCFALPSGLSPKERDYRLQIAMCQAEIVGLESSYPDEISGGQKSRVNVMRTLLAEPKCLLLDEPFSALDAKLRENFRSFVFAQIEKVNIPVIMVTHDLEDIAPGAKILDISNENH